MYFSVHLIFSYHSCFSLWFHSHFILFLASKLRALLKWRGFGATRTFFKEEKFPAKCRITTIVSNYKPTERSSSMRVARGMQPPSILLWRSSLLWWAWSQCHATNSKACVGNFPTSFQRLYEHSRRRVITSIYRTTQSLSFRPSDNMTS